jgi:hypothetical protein
LVRRHRSFRLAQLVRTVQWCPLVQWVRKHRWCRSVRSDRMVPWYPLVRLVRILL